MNLRRFLFAVMLAALAAPGLHAAKQTFRLHAHALHRHHLGGTAQRWCQRPCPQPQHRGPRARRGARHADDAGGASLAARACRRFRALYRDAPKALNPGGLIQFLAETQKIGYIILRQIVADEGPRSRHNGPHV